MSAAGETTKSPFERILFYTGSILAIAVAGFTIWDHFSKASPPDLHISFAYSDSQLLRVLPTIDDKDPEWVYPFPLGLVVSNRGGQTASGTVMNIVHPRNLKIESLNKDVRATHQLISSGTERMVLTSVPLGDIHPDQTLHLDDAVYAATENTVQMSVPITSSDNVPGIVDVSLLVTYDIRVQVAAKDTPERTSSLYLTVGGQEQLDKLGQPYWEATKTEMRLHK
ncbi:MAG: hypothetical protein QOH93_1539 [Chloroflexia bacterium]|jgi:hypothetical protein|nr:hypothetical protein [Chloroflexia bacterium]